MVGAVTTSQIPVAAAGEARLPALTEGETLAARVVAQDAAGVTRLALGKATLDLRLPVQLEAGAAVQLKVLAGGAEPKLALLVDAAGKPVPPPLAAPAAGTAPAAAPAASGAAAEKLAAVILDAVGGARGAPPQPLEAKVTAQLPDGKVRIEISGARVEIRPPAPLPTGSTVRLSVESDGAAVRIRFVDAAQGATRPASAQGPAQATSQATTQATSGSPAQSPMQSPAQASAPPSAQAATGAAQTRPGVPTSGPAQPAAPQASLQGAAPQTATLAARPAPGNLARPAPGASAQPALAPAVVAARVVAEGANGAVRVELPPVTAELRPPQPAANGETVRLQPRAEGASLRLVATGPAQAADAARPVGTPLPVLSAKNLPPLAKGAVLEATVTGRTPDGAVQLRSGAAQFQLRPPASLPAGSFDTGSFSTGASVRLQVEIGGKAPAVRLLVPAAGAAEAAASKIPAETLKLLRQVAEVARPLAATRQDSMAPLYANMASVLRAGGGGLPDTVTKVMQDLFGFRMSATDASSPAALKQAVQRSGTFFEANLARLGAGRGQAGAAQPQPGAQPGGDLKSSLMQLRGALVAFLGKETAPATRKTANQPPPRSGALPRGQMPSQPTLAAEATPREAARVLLADTDAALARIRLSQMASLGGHEHAARGTSAPQAEWTFELPLALGAQTAVAQFHIARDGGNEAGEGAAEGGWKLRFSLDLPETGAVDTLLALRGGTAAVTIWAEDPGTAERMRADADALREAFADAGLEATRIDIRRGRPSAVPQKAGYFVDWQT